MASIDDDTHSNKHRGDDFAARHAHIRHRLLDTIEATLDRLHPVEPRLDAPRETIGRIRAQLALLVCPNAKCRRAQTCRRKPCTALPAD